MQWADSHARSRRIPAVVALLLIFVASCTDDPSSPNPTWQSTTTTVPCTVWRAASSDEASLGATPTLPETVGCDIRIRELQTLIAEMESDLIAMPTRMRLAALDTCEEGQWSDPQLGFRSFEECYETQMSSYEQSLALSGTAVLDALREELDRLQARVASG